MEMCESVKDKEWKVTHDGVAFWKQNGTISTIWEMTDEQALLQHKAALPYWLHEAMIYKQSYQGTLTEYTTEKARADAAEALVQRMKKEIEYEIEILTLRGSNGRAEELKALLSTLFSDPLLLKDGV